MAETVKLSATAKKGSPQGASPRGSVITRFFTTAAGGFVLLGLLLTTLIMPRILGYVLSFVLPYFLAPQLIPAYWLLTLLAEWVEKRKTGKVKHTFRWALGACFWMSYHVATFVPGVFVGFLAGLGSFVLLLAVLRLWHRLIDLKSRQAHDKASMRQVEQRAERTTRMSVTTIARGLMSGQSFPLVTFLCVELGKGIWILATAVLHGVLPIVLPIALGYYLPPQLIAVYWLLAHLAEWVEVRITGKVRHTFLWALGACIAASGHLAAFVPGTFAKVVVSLVGFLLLLLVLANWQRLIGVKDEEEMNPAEKRVARLLYQGEFAMGGPEICTYVLPDGAVILNGGVEQQFSPDGRYFATLSPSRGDWALIIYDLKKQVLHTCSIDNAIRKLRDVGIQFIWASAESDPRDEGCQLSIANLLQSSTKQKMVAVSGLKLTEDEWKRVRWLYSLPFPEPPLESAVQLNWQPLLPDNLIDRDDPLEALRRPMAEIVVGRKASGLQVEMNAAAITWRQDGQALLCQAERKDGSEHGYWLWQAHKDWRHLPSLQDLQQYAPYGSQASQAKLDSGQMILTWELAQPELSEKSHGTLASYIHAPLQIGGQRFDQPIVQQVLDLESAVGNEYLQSAALQNGERLTWRFLRHDDEIFRDVYECSWQDQVLPGEWLLDHRLSSDGRYLALMAHAAAPAVPHRIAIIDAHSGSWSWVEGTFYFPEMQGFSERTLHIVELAGRQAETDEPMGLTDPAPADVRAVTDPDLSATSATASLDGTAARPAPELSRDWFIEDGDFRLQYVRRTISLRDSIWRAD